ncbi:MAG: cell surface protein SprA, partial [Crocinitomicaceae bacterium]|nr:cell surface protein SprA [Crocinitomicaceae bacterium]
VGSLSQDGITAPQALILKMLKSSITMVNLTNGSPSPLWDNMMKNVYNLGAFGLSQENFRLDVWYNNPATGVNMNYIPRVPLDGKLLIQVLNLDRIDAQQMPYPDGFFDFINNAATSGGLIDSQSGRIYFPVTEPFGGHLSKKIHDGLGNTPEADAVISQVVFQQLYDSTKTSAQINFPQLNRFKIKGQYQSASGSDISLNALNIPQGSVSVTAGGIRLVEGQDYTVDYNLGRVKIINDGVMASGQPIKVSVESNSMFNLQFKTMIGSRFDYKFSDNFAVGATFMNLRERPLTQKVNVGEEPVNNTVIGGDFNYQKEAPFLTNLVDRIPRINTKEKSTITFSGEAAKLFPGHSKAISKDGNAYVDDFEGSQSVIDLRSLNQWFLASTPKLQPSLFPEGDIENSLSYGYNRAHLSWYVMDPLFFRQNSLTPPNVNADMQSDHRMREVLEAEVFPNRQLPPGTPPNIATLDLTYYPSERGPYNYELPDGEDGISYGLNQDGTLKEPADRWAGIQRSLNTTDFELSNVQFIQFWLMDPFNDDSENTNGGDLYFNLGNVSEDVLNDSQMSFENGFPNSNNQLPVAEGVWGLYPNGTFNVVNAFDNSSGNYVQQDIGLDGMNSANERTFFAEWLSDIQAGLNSDAYASYVKDPSADDYAYFRSSQADSQGLSTIERYKYYNGNEGNSNTATPDGYPITATTIPNSEDINQDITLNTIESYFQYKVSLHPGDMGDANIGRNYITDSFVTTKNTANGEERQIRWYQFKIPISEFENRIGNIPDFRSVRYIRMFLKGWSEPVTLRFARLELVRGEWRRYSQSLQGPQENEPTDNDQTVFNIAAVNIEENGNRDPIPYVVPPGIIREQDVASANLRNLNEQSLSLEICNLQDGDARAAYRTVRYDMRQYKRLRMFAHMEALGNEADLKSKDLSVFIRLGSDFDQNYYEYEIPLEVTPWYTNDDNEIWPENNNFDILLKDLQNLKAGRPSSHSALLEYSKMLDNVKRIAVKGNPNLANVTVLMIGVRNHSKTNNVFISNDDGKSKCAIIWVNELRLSEFDESSGWAAVASMNAQLADFATVAVAGNISKPGWGQLEQRVMQRQQETKMGFDANSTMQMGKFFPENWGVQLPMYVGYSETYQTPRYDPLQPDLELNDLPNVTKPQKKRSTTFTKRRSVNFNNIKISPKKESGDKPPAEGELPKAETKDPKEAKPGGQKDKERKIRFYSIENFSVSYSYNETYFSDINMDWRLNKQYKGGFDYNFTNKPKEIKPFAKIPVISTSKYLKWVKEFNFYPGIKQFGFHTDMNRTYETSRIRNNSLELTGVYSDMLIQTQVQKNWNWGRQYTFKYDLTKNLKVDFAASNLGLVTEPRGVIDKENREWYDAYKDTVWQNIRNFGETTNYNHNTSATYKLPLDKFPLIDFVSADARYGSTYSWTRAPFTQDSLGATIQNSRQLQLNAQGNFETLYNKSELLKRINQGKKENDKKDNKKEKDDPTTKDGFGKDTKEKKEKKEKINPLDLGLRFLMMVRNVSGSYTRNEGILLPGYDRKTKVLGMDENFDGPGWGFLAGQQNTDIWGHDTGNNYALNAASNGWLVRQPNLNNQYNETYSENWNAKANLEPVKYFKIELNANKQVGTNMTSFFRFDEDIQSYAFQSPMETGNYSASINTWATAFVKDNPDDNYNSSTFMTFLENRLVTSERLNREAYNVDSPEVNGYYNGWGPLSQQVVIPAFIAAYSGNDPKDVALNPFKTKAQPNWKVTYDGLTKLAAVKKYFKQFNINHQYRSTMTTSYVTNLNYTEDAKGRPSALDEAETPNWISQHQINTVTISEQLSPLIGFDMTLKTKKANDPQIKIEYKKDRTVALGMTNYQITETKSNSLVFGVGYKITEIPNPLARKKGSRLPIQLLKNTAINLRCDLTVRDNSTLIRKIQERQNQITAGQRIISIKGSADMAVSDKLTIRLFYDQQLNKPKISTSFPTSNISAGLALRFTLGG